jgi:HAD superfamily hydrolase (TIGR01549 family)
MEHTLTNVDDLYSTSNIAKLNFELYQLGGVYGFENSLTNDIVVDTVVDKIKSIDTRIELHDTRVYENMSSLRHNRNKIKHMLKNTIYDPYEQTIDSQGDKTYIVSDVQYRPSINLISAIKKQRKTVRRKTSKKGKQRQLLYKIVENIDQSLTDDSLTLYYPLRSYDRNLEKIELMTHESEAIRLNEDYYKQKLKDFSMVHDKAWKTKFLEKGDINEITQLSRHLHAISSQIPDKMIYIDIGCGDGFYADAVARILERRHSNSLIRTNQYYNIPNRLPLYFGVDIIKSTNVHKLQKGLVYLSKSNMVYLKAPKLTEPNAEIEEYYNIDNQTGRQTRKTLYGHFITCVNYFNRFDKSLHVPALINIASMVKKGGLLYIQDHDVHPNDTDYRNILSKYLHLTGTNFPYRGLLIYVLQLLGFRLIEEYTLFEDNFTNEFRCTFINEQFMVTTSRFDEKTYVINDVTYQPEDIYNKYILPELNRYTFTHLREYMIQLSNPFVDKQKFDVYSHTSMQLQHAQQRSMFANTSLDYTGFVTDLYEYWSKFEQKLGSRGRVLHNLQSDVAFYEKREPHVLKYDEFNIVEQNKNTQSLYSFHYGQLKLLLSELLILMQPEYLNNIKYIIYVGSAPGNHLPIIHELFKTQNLKFILYDGARFDMNVFQNSQLQNDERYIEIPNVDHNTRKGSLFDDTALNDIKRRILLKSTDPEYIDIDKTFFVSDIRNESYGEEKKSVPDEEAIVIDMLLQQYWVEELRPKYCLFKFRLPWNDSIEKNVVYNVRQLLINSSIIPEAMKTEDALHRYDAMFNRTVTYDEFGSSSTALQFSYLDGELYIQAYPRVNTKETRLFIDRDSHNYNAVMRNCNEYEGKMSYFNSYLRRICYDISLPIDEEIEGCCSCYDCKTFDIVYQNIFELNMFEYGRFESHRDMKEHTVDYLVNNGEKNYFIRHYLHNLQKTTDIVPTMLTRKLNMFQKDLDTYLFPDPTSHIVEEPDVDIEDILTEDILTGGMDTSVRTIKCVLFDWGGTLAQSNKRNLFIAGDSYEKRNTLWIDTIDTLDYLRSKDIKMGIVSNTSYDTDELRKALHDADMDKYFDTQVYSSELGMCKKKCKQIFESVLEELDIEPSECIYVGDNYEKDVIGALRVGMIPIHFNRNMNDDIDYDKNGVVSIKYLNILKDLIV